MQGGALAELKAATATAHRQVEDALDLLDPGLTTDRLRAVLARLYGFWAGNEAAVGRCLAADPRLAATLQWGRRARCDGLRADVRALGGDPAEAPIAQPALAHVDTAAALGWLYVAEGSTLGGAVLARKLGPLTPPLPAPLRFFSPYPEGPGPMWTSYRSIVEEWAGQDARRIGETARRARQVFAALEAWLAPLRREAAA
ncbi:biliverdin-producing heme oxygenase [uncultured Jatrophihabitans sp.]|uniref:biliverdin-producing heme oxygenase n=1 Tax=uncultured Jatrophihabitans sp. TaxID=1610747 RepID=UPI0035C9593B